MKYIGDYIQRNWINYFIFFTILTGVSFIDRLPEIASPIITATPVVLYCIALILAVLLNKSKVYFTLILSAVGLAILHSSPTDNRFFELLFFSGGLLIPTNCYIFSHTSERGILSNRGKLKMGFLVVQALIILYLLIFQEQLLYALKQSDLLPASLQHNFVPDDLVLVTFVFFLMIFKLKDIYKRDSNQSLYFFSLLTLFMAFLKPHDILWFSLFMSGNALYHLTILLKKSYTMAYLDDLTGIPGRRALNEDLLKLSGIYCIAMIDIDHFKRFNDEHGHDCGDEALRQVAKLIKKMTRSGRAYRYGGEEFTILYPGCNSVHALNNLEMIRQVIEKEPINCPASEHYPHKKNTLTLSIGLAERDIETQPITVLRRADRALYRAKDKGRNCISQ